MMEGEGDLLRAARLALREFRMGCDKLAYAIITAEEDMASIGWHFPVGTDKYPPEMWYVAVVHDTSPQGVLNPGYGGPHTGIDLNVDVRPWGDIDRGLPVWAVADGVVHGTWHSERNLGSGAAVRARAHDLAGRGWQRGAGEGDLCALRGRSIRPV